MSIPDLLPICALVMPFALCLDWFAINSLLRKEGATVSDEVRSRLRIGSHRGIQVTDVSDAPAQLVSQAFCSALPVAYSMIPSEPWAKFAKLILEAAYEASLLDTECEVSLGADPTLFSLRDCGRRLCQCGELDPCVNRARIATCSARPRWMSGSSTCGAPSPELAAMIRKFA